MEVAFTGQAPLVHCERKFEDGDVKTKGAAGEKVCAYL